MTRDFGPFPSKPMYEVVNRRMQRALAEATVSTGFAGPGQGAVTAGTGAQLVIAAYPDGALVDGLYVENPEDEPVTLTTNSGSTNPRIDRLVMRLDMGAETIAPFQIVGTPAATPQPPPLVQTATVYDMPLVQYRLPGSGSAQNPGSIVDERTSSSPATTLLAYKAATTNRTAATLLADPDLVITVAAGTYWVEVEGTAQNTAGSTQSLQWSFGGGTATFTCPPQAVQAHYQGQGPGLAPVALSITPGVASGAAPSVNASTVNSFRFSFPAVVTVGGTLAFMWAPGTASGVGLNMLAGARMRAAGPT